MIYIVKTNNLKQKRPDSCAIKCHELILRDYGINVTEDELIDLARKHGWFTENVGVYMRHNGLLLAGFGIKYHHSQDNTLDDISYELSLSHRIMVNVNREKLSIAPSSNLHEEACHAILITKVDNKYVTVIDPMDGVPDKRINIGRFIMAWKDSDCYMLATCDKPLCNLSQSFYHIEHTYNP